MRDEEPEEESPYYPPRASLGSGVRHWWEGFERRLLQNSGLPTHLSLWQLLSGLCVPGFGFRFERSLVPLRLILGGWFLGLIAFLYLLSAPPTRLGAFQLDPAYLAFGLMISLHSTSANHWVVRLWGLETIVRRIFAGVVVTAFLIFVVYFPIWNGVLQHFVLPVDVAGVRIMIHPGGTAEGIQRGDLVLYHIQESYTRGVRVEAGYGLERVLGLPGDQVRFEGRGFWVNDLRQPSRPEMPAEGGLVVPEKHWFIWPDLHTGGYGTGLAARRQEAFLKLALVAQVNFAGRPYRTWLFRKQTLP